MATKVAEMNAVRSPVLAGSRKRKRTRPQPSAASGGATATADKASPHLSHSIVCKSECLKRVKIEHNEDEEEEEEVAAQSPSATVKAEVEDESPKTPGANALAESGAGAGEDDWPPASMLRLLQSVRQTLADTGPDVMRYTTRAARLDWTLVAFADFSAADCRRQWDRITVKLRRFRTMSDLLTDADEWVKHPNTAFGRKPIRHPDAPKKPLTPYFRFFLAKRQKFSRRRPELMMTELSKLISTQYRSLAEHKKKRYTDEFLAENEIYKVDYAKYRDAHPELFKRRASSSASGGREYVPTVGGCAPRPSTAMQLYINHKIEERLQSSTDVGRKVLTETYRERWGKLVDHKKMKYINKALEAKIKYDIDMEMFCQLNPEYQPKAIATFLTKAQLKIKERSEGKPDKPAPNAYALFTLLKLPTLSDVANNQRMAEVSCLWKKLSAEQRLTFKESARKNAAEYRRKLQRYIDTLAEPDRQPHMAELHAEMKKERKATKTPAGGDDGDDVQAGRPQKPVAAVFVFMAEQQTAYEEKFPGVDRKDLTRLMINDFEKLSTAKQEKYRKMADKQREENKSRMETAAKGSKATKELFPGEPKRPPTSGYQLYSKSLLATIKDLPSNRRLREIANRWHAFSDSERDIYSKKRDTLQRRYQRDLEAFKKKLSPNDLKHYELLHRKSPRAMKKESLAVAALKAAASKSSKSDSGSDDDSDSDNDSSDDDDDDSGDATTPAAAAATPVRNGVKGDKLQAVDDASEESSSSESSDDDDDDDDDDSGSDEDSDSS